MKASAKAGGAPEIEDGVYTSTCYAAEDTVAPAGDFGFGPKPERDVVVLKMLIEDVVDEEGNNLIIDTKWLTPSTHEKATLAKFGSILLGRDITGQEIDTEELVAGRCQVLIEHNDKGWPYVKDMMPLPRTRTRASAAAAATS